LLILFVAHQWFAWFKRKEDRELKQTGWWFALGNLANGLWVVAWLNEQMGLSVLLILVLLFSLIQLTIRLRLKTWNAPLRIIAFVWWPLTIYLGWIIVATVANISVFLVSIGWQGGFLPEQVWTILMIVAATVIYLMLIKTRNMREAAVVGIWALVAIAVKQWQTNNEIVIAALTASAILFVVIVVHGFKNRKTGKIYGSRTG
jgi:predicted histidine transporter YuiF (NhaC family)